MRREGNLPIYDAWDSFNRSSISQQAMVHFEQNLVDNIQRRMPGRIRRWLMDFQNEIKATAIRLTAELLNGVGTMYGYSLMNLDQKPFKFIPLMFKMQEDLFIAGIKTFAVVPMNSHMVRYIDLTNTGLKELIQREKGLRLNTKKPPLDPEFTANIRNHWRSLFKIEMFESEAKNVKFRSLSTDGFAVSVIMTRPKRLQQVAKTTMDPIEPQADFLIGLDPGYCLTIAGVSRDIGPEASQDMEKNEKIIKLSGKEWHELTGANKRKDRLEAMTGDLEAEIRAECERRDNIGPFLQTLPATRASS